ncbi:hypothetical protein SMICM304S_01487 [Streptomyces microflavus]
MAALVAVPDLVRLTPAPGGRWSVRGNAEGRPGPIRVCGPPAAIRPVLRARGAARRIGHIGQRAADAVTVDAVEAQPVVAPVADDGQVGPDRGEPQAVYEVHIVEAARGIVGLAAGGADRDWSVRAFRS